jgi:DNA polymerase I-like protein with 3'-5' exonuclease and polymerase domains
MLRYHGAVIASERYAFDSQILAHVTLRKIEPSWLLSYEIERKVRNKAGGKHRDAGPLSLKTQAPYFLGVPAFWETTDHDNDEYVSLDAIYSYRLTEKLLGFVKEEGQYEFFRDYMMPWAQMLLDAECRGIRLDLDLLDKKQAEAERRSEELRQQLDTVWAPAYHAYRELQIEELKKNYAEKESVAVAKAKNK